MKRSVKVAPAAVEQASLPVDAVTEELPEAAPAVKKSYTSAQDLIDSLNTPEQLVTLPPVRAKVCTSKNGKPFLRFRHNGVLHEVYESDEGMVFPDGLVSGAVVTATVDIRANDGIETKVASNGGVYKTIFAVNCEIA